MQLTLVGMFLPNATAPTDDWPSTGTAPIAKFDMSDGIPRNYAAFRVLITGNVRWLEQVVEAPITNMV